MSEQSRKSQEQEELEKEVRLEALKSRFKELSEQLKKLGDEIKAVSAEMHNIAELVREAHKKSDKTKKN